MDSLSYNSIKDKFFYLIFDLNPKWLWDKKYDNIPPDIINDVPMLSAQLKYKDVDEYRNVMYPMLVHEFWYELKQDFEEFMQPKKMKIVVAKRLNEMSERIIPVNNDSEHNIFSLHLITTVCDDNCYPGRGDLVMVTGIDKSKQNFEVFAYVDNLDKYNNSDDPTESTITLVYTLLTNICLQNSEYSRCSLIKVSFLSRYLSIIDALQSLPRLDLCQSILCPTVESYRISSSEELKSSDIVTKQNPNDMQLKVMSGIVKTIELKAPKICLVQGPPGTGKSKTIVNIIATILKRKSTTKILVCAPSNKAIDSVAIQLLNLQPILKGQGIVPYITRIGDEDKIDYRVKRISLSKQATREKWIINHARAQEDYYSRRGRRPYLNLHQIKGIIINRANIITSTLTSCYTTNIMTSVFRSGPFESELPVCIIDEAGQATELQTLVPLLLGVKQLILVGDPQQLPPIILSQKAKDHGYDTSLFVRAQKNFKDEEINPIVMLDTQYRMADSISQWPNFYFYKSALKDAAPMNPLGICNYTLFNHKYLQDKDGHANKEEAKLVVMLIKLLKKQLHSKITNGEINIGVITPYHKQRILIQRMLGFKQIQKPYEKLSEITEKLTEKHENDLNNGSDRKKSETKSKKNPKDKKLENNSDDYDSNDEKNPTDKEKLKNDSNDDEKDSENELTVILERKLKINSNENSDGTEEPENDCGDDNDDEVLKKNILMPVEKLEIESKENLGNKEEEEVNIKPIKCSGKIEEFKNNLDDDKIESEKDISVILEEKLINELEENFNKLDLHEDNDNGKHSENIFVITIDEYLKKRLAENSEYKEGVKNGSDDNDRTSEEKSAALSEKKSKKKPAENLKNENYEKDIFIEVKTVDSFQGSERDIIIMSCVRSCGLGFTKDPNRLCVSLTRAKHTLILLGNFKTFSSNEMWSSLINNAAERNAFINIENADAESTLKKHVILGEPKNSHN